MAIYDAIYRKRLCRRLTWPKDDALFALKGFRFVNNSTGIFVKIATDFLTLSNILN
jgi:hypothetical protein